MSFFKKIFANDEKKESEKESTGEESSTLTNNKKRKFEHNITKKTVILPKYEDDIHNNIKIMGIDIEIIVRQLLFVFEGFFVKPFLNQFFLLVSRTVVIPSPKKVIYHFYVKKEESKDESPTIIGLEYKKLTESIEQVDESFIWNHVYGEKLEKNVSHFIVYKNL